MGGGHKAALISLQPCKGDKRGPFRVGSHPRRASGPTGSARNWTSGNSSPNLHRTHLGRHKAFLAALSDMLRQSAQCAIFLALEEAAHKGYCLLLGRGGSTEEMEASGESKSPPPRGSHGQTGDRAGGEAPSSLHLGFFPWTSGEPAGPRASGRCRLRLEERLPRLLRAPGRHFLLGATLCLSFAPSSRLDFCPGANGVYGCAEVKL